ncbi:MAG: hypothetical protein ABIK09_13730 [Pseudomonadota bacterium]
MRRPATILVLFMALSSAGPARASDGVIAQEREGGLLAPAWPVTAAWDEAAEAEFSAWVQRLGEARERKSRRLRHLLGDPEANSLWSPEDGEINWKTDCATLAYALRGYFAYKTGRPFSFQGYTWKRYTPGNHPKRIKDWSQYSHPWRAIRAAMTAANSGSFRMRPELEGTDTYPVEVTPYCVQPGVTYYEPNGHVLVVYRVDRDTGEIRLMDSHPDGTLTLKTFGPKLVRGTARFGGGFRGWRHYRLEVLNVAAGTFRIIRERNAEMPCFDGLEPYKTGYLVDGEQVPYHEFVQARMRGAGVVVDPLEEFPLRLEAFCEDVQRRMDRVEATTAEGLPGKAHPRSLPNNIYRAKGDWARHGTANLDAQLRFEAMELRRMVMETLKWAASGRERLSYDGGPGDLLDDYRTIWAIYKADPTCRFAYTSSTGRRVSLDLTTVFHRIWDLSFDPYHCPELRWGAGLAYDGDPGPELASCPDGKTKRAWYDKEKRLRHRHIAKRSGSIQLQHGPTAPPGPADPGILLEGVFPGADLQALLDVLRALPGHLTTTQG